ncbi:MAG: glycosyltransferase [Verrucomicrobiota bacterium]|jgi:processive 1,2-diacylglycerol beta-glucosyltransferase
MKQRILFLYLTKHSGHYAAAVAVEAAAQQLNGGVESMLLDSFSHANPLLSKMTLKAYLAALKTAPEIWEWMYDNPAFQKRTVLIRDLLNRGNSRKMEKVLREFNPDVVVCTQAFACGVLAAWKQKTGNRLPALVGVLTDFVAHRYWAHNQVDLYITPNDATRGTLISQGVAPERIRVHGIPVSERFLTTTDKDAVYRSLDLKPGLPLILLMGGSLGLGPMKSVIRKLDRLPQPFYIVAVTGKNEELRERLERRGAKLRHQTRIFSFVENVNELMDAAELVVTKPGGITTAECLIKRLPMIIINPIPGQEAKNTSLLLAQNVAVQAEKAKDVAELVDEFLRNPDRLRAMREAARSLGRPNAARDAAVDILSLCATRP